MTPRSPVSDIPARLDRLPWGAFHTRLVVTLGICWILDGYEVAVASNVAEQLAQPAHLNLNQFTVVALGCVYLLGEVVGALYYGYRSDAAGRRRLFLRTLGLYMLGSLATVALLGTGSLSVTWLFVARFVAGLGIGGEYAAINSTIDELVPARFRGRVDIAVNGTYWAGATTAALVQIPLLSGHLNSAYDWRLALVLGPLVALIVGGWRRDLPESPRWLVAHNRPAEADEVVTKIEDDLERQGYRFEPVKDLPADSTARWADTTYGCMVSVFRHAFRRRVRLCASIMVAQSVLYNAVFFSFPAVLVGINGVDPSDTAKYLVPFAVCNLLGPLALGPFFDTVGRRAMISRTYLMSGLFLAAGIFVMAQQNIPVWSQVAMLSVAFFFASAGSSSAYLTVSELFPVQMRAKTTAVFLAVAQMFGLAATLLYGLVVDGGDKQVVLGSLSVGAAGMVVAGLVAHRLAVNSENLSLEEISNRDRGER